MKTRMMLPLLLVSAAFITPASANWFHNPYQNINRFIGSAPNPTPEDIRLMRTIVVTKDEQANPDAANKTASVETAPSAPAQGGGTGSVPPASPSR